MEETEGEGDHRSAVVRIEFRVGFVAVSGGGEGIGIGIGVGVKGGVEIGVGDEELGGVGEAAELEEG